MYKKNTTNSFLIIFMVIILCFLANVLYANIFRVYTEWNRRVELWNKEIIIVKTKHSRWMYLLHMHSLPTIGGGDDRYEIRFIYDGKQFKWEGIYFPIALQIDESGKYIVCFDEYPKFHNNCNPNATDGLFYETYCKHARFWFYKYSDGIWVEINSNSFPQKLAIQNLNTWLWSPSRLIGFRTPDVDENIYTFRRLIKSYDFFCKSITANLWYYLENKRYMKNKDCCVDLKLIENYYNKWIYK